MTYTFNNEEPELFLSIVHEVASWLAGRGQTMWELETLTATNLFDEYTSGNSYIMYTDGIPSATFILQWKDPLYYGDLPEDTAGIIHKLAIRRSFSGQNQFLPILDFCRSECLKRNIHQIQLETDATRPALMQFYERSGFVPQYQKEIHEFGQTFQCQFYLLEF